MWSGTQKNQFPLHKQDLILKSDKANDKANAINLSNFIIRLSLVT